MENSDIKEQEKKSYNPKSETFNLPYELQYFHLSEIIWNYKSSHLDLNYAFPSKCI